MKGKRSITVIVFLLFLGIAYSTQAWDQEGDQEAIFFWVAQMLRITPGEERPRIIELSETELRELFMVSTEKSLTRLRESLIDMGWDRDEATNFVGNLANDVAGFLVKNDRHIYIKDSLEPCYKASIMAHEITHFFQVQYNLSGEEARELQAEYLERKYREEHCIDP